MSVALVLSDTQDVFNKKLLKACCDFLNESFHKVIPDLQKQIGDLVIAAFDKSQEIQSIRNGDLRAELGFVSPDYIIGQLFDAIRSDIYLNFDKFSTNGININGKIQVGIIKSDYSTLLKIPKATYESGGYTVKWLEWLLFEGGNIIIAGFHIKFGSFPQSRSGKAIMQPGGVYAIPPAYAGVKDNNFITRVLNGFFLDQLNTLVVNQLSKAIP